MTSADETLKQGPILMYDGSCGVCSESVQWVLKHERSHELRFVALESELGVALRAAAGVPPTEDSVVWVELRDGAARAELRSTAVLRVLGYVGGPWRALAVLRVVPRFLRDGVYRMFAKVRLSLRAPACLVPTPEERARFLKA